MGGGGGIFTGPYTPEHFRDVARQSEESTEKAVYDAEVNDLINELLSSFNSRDAEGIGESLAEIREILEEDTDGTIETRFGGSVRKHTYVDGLSDVDVILLIDKTELSELSPKEVLGYVASKLEDETPSGVDEIRVGNMTVTLVRRDGTEIQLLPSIRRGGGLRIPGEAGDKWSDVVRPDDFASRLTESNQSMNRKVIPVVKLAKAVVSDFPENSRLTGYHVESMAIEAFRSYPNTKNMTTKEMLVHFFESGREIVKRPVRDKTGQSYHVDDYLGTENSEERIRVSNRLDRVAKRMERADAARSVEEWDEILGGGT